MTEEQPDRTKEYADRMLTLLSRLRRYHSALSDIASETKNGASTMSDIARTALRAESLSDTDVLSADLHWPRDNVKMVEELQGTITRSVTLALEDYPAHKSAAHDIRNALRDGIEQAARNIATIIEEYGR